MPEAIVIDVGRRLQKVPEDPANGPLRVNKITINHDDYELITHPKDHVLAIEDDDDDDDWDDCEAPLTVADTTSPKVVDNSAAIASPAAVDAHPKQPLVKRISNKNTQADSLSFDNVGETTQKNTTWLSFYMKKSTTTSYTGSERPFYGGCWVKTMLEIHE
ncbi:hypothetical protein ACHAP4_003452 [Fusarium culmorum]